MDPKDFTSERAGKLQRHERGFLTFVPHPLPPAIEYSPALISLLSEADRLLGELAGVGRMLPNPYFLVGPAIRREAVVSSRIEGTETGMEDLFFFEAEPKDPPGKPDVREVYNYVVALEYGLKRLEELPVSVRLVREIHQRLMQGVRGGRAYPGEFRTTPNWIGKAGCGLDDATFVPPPEYLLSEVLKEWETYIHTADSTPPLIRLAFIHYQFEAIHPFVDGNGRVGRLLLSLLMCHWGLLPQPLLYLSEFFEQYRDDYYRHLIRISQHGEWESWVEFFLRGIRQQSQASLGTAKALLDLQTAYRSILHGRRISKATISTLEQLFVNPVVTAPMIRDRDQVDFRTAQAAIDDLVQVGILHEIAERRRNRSWVAPEILRVVTGQRSA